MTLDLVEPVMAEERIKNIEVFNQKYKAYFSEIDKNARQQSILGENRTMSLSRGISREKPSVILETTQLGLNRTGNYNLDSTFKNSVLNIED